MADWYCGSTNWTAVTQWAASTAYVIGDLRRQLATPAVGSERVFRCTTAGTSDTIEPTWSLARGTTTADNTVVWTEVTGNSAYGWNAAHARLFVSSDSFDAGDTIYVSNNHAETQSTAKTMTSQGTAVLPMKVLCVVDTVSPPTTLASTASITTTVGANMVLEGFTYYYGINFNCGSGINSPLLIICNSNTPNETIFDTCNLNLIATGTAMQLRLGPSASAVNDDVLIRFWNTNFQFSSTYHTVVFRHGKFFWDGGTITGTTFPTTLLTSSAGTASTFTLNGCDLSPLGSNNLVAGNIACASTVNIKNCKLGTNAVILTGTIPGPGGINVFLDNCDSADTNYRFSYSKYQGSVTHATNCYLNATYSIKMTPITGAQYISPLESSCIAQWNSTTGSAKTATVEIIHSESADLNDNEIWVELEYLGTTGFPIASFVNDKMAWLGTPAAQTTSTAAWVEDLTGERKQKLSVSFTPQKAGYIVAKVYLAKVTTNSVYVDPYITVS